MALTVGGGFVTVKRPVRDTVVPSVLITLTPYDPAVALEGIFSVPDIRVLEITFTSVRLILVIPRVIIHQRSRLESGAGKARYTH